MRTTYYHRNYQMPIILAGSGRPAAVEHTQLQRRYLTIIATLRFRPV